MHYRLESCALPSVHRLFILLGGWTPCHGLVIVQACLCLAVAEMLLARVQGSGHG